MITITNNNSKMFWKTMRRTFTWSSAQALFRLSQTEMKYGRLCWAGCIKDQYVSHFICKMTQITVWSSLIFNCFHAKTSQYKLVLLTLTEDIIFHSNTTHHKALCFKLWPSYVKGLKQGLSTLYTHRTHIRAAINVFICSPLRHDCFCVWLCCHWPGLDWLCFLRTVELNCVCGPSFCSGWMWVMQVAGRELKWRCSNIFDDMVTHRLQCQAQPADTSTGDTTQIFLTIGNFDTRNVLIRISRMSQIRIC